MKFISHRFEGVERFGAVEGNGIVDLTARFGDRFPTLRHAMEAQAMGRLCDAAAGADADYGLDSVQLLLGADNR